MEPLDLKGKSEPVPAFRLIRSIPGAEGHARRMESPMVGRDSELRSPGAGVRPIHGRSARACSSRCSARPAWGNRGFRRSSSPGPATFAVLRGRCLHYGEGIDLSGRSSMCSRRPRGIDEGDIAEEARGKLDAVLDGAPDAEIIATRLMNLLGLGGQAAPDETFWAIRRIFEHLASTEPLVVVLDDIQWAEPTLLDLIEHVADWSREAPTSCSAWHARTCWTIAPGGVGAR